jgi:hemolysin III
VIELRDPVSSASHLFTAAWAVFATLVMMRLAAARPARLAPVIIFGVSMVCLYLASGVFHGLHYETPEQKRFFQQVDQSAIFLLIAGTYTPVLSILLAGAWRKWLLRVVWSLAFLGIGSLWLLPKAPHSLTVGIYLFLGWVGILPVAHYYRAVGWRAMNWVWAGAGLYSLGAACELARWPVIVPGWIQAHEVLHVFDAAASVALFLFIVRYVIPYQAPVSATVECAPT